MTNQERLALADRVQKCIQEKLVQFQIMCRKEQIEREYKLDRNTRKKI
ncbi:hypothetical protein D1AOALGA4SA_737 [Olavius algarvensis Delta 1 endosymbiont]|nr:hypothetical protein D1AOALGA4SA_737 [Olavius algarvensis Delta 1 endosymbiont]